MTDYRTEVRAAERVAILPRVGSESVRLVKEAGSHEFTNLDLRVLWFERVVLIDDAVIATAWGSFGYDGVFSSSHAFFVGSRHVTVNG